MYLVGPGIIVTGRVVALMNVVGSVVVPLVSSVVVLTVGPVVMLAVDPVSNVVVRSVEFDSFVVIPAVVTTLDVVVGARLVLVGQQCAI